MAIRSKASSVAVAFVLLALVAAPIAGEVFAASDMHACCPERAPVADAPLPCQYVAALECCAQQSLPSTRAGDGSRSTQTAFALGAVAGPLPVPPVPPRLCVVTRALEHHPIPPLLRKSVLVL